jgi:hypothetical protein
MLLALSAQLIVAKTVFGLAYGFMFERLPPASTARTGRVGGEAVTRHLFKLSADDAFVAS